MQRTGNLIITRRRHEAFRIGESVRVTVVRIDGERVTLAIEAPTCVTVLRCELDKHGADLTEPPSIG